MIVKFALLIFGVNILLQCAVTNPVNDTPDEDPHLWEKSGKFQGDMVLTAEQVEAVFSDIEARNGVRSTSRHWPNRVVPYVFSDDFDAAQKAKIENVLAENYNKTCISIVPRTNQPDYILVTGKNTGCWSHVGRMQGKQILNLQPEGCLYKSSITHEFMHAVGFYHQHSATERDNYLTIQWQNIKDGWSYAFDKYASNAISSYGQPYDYESVMHYTAHAFSKNDKKTIVTKFPTKFKIGTAQRLSSIDIAKINKMYGC